MVSETLNSPLKVLSILQSSPIGAEIVRAKIGNEDPDLTMAGKDCVLTSSEEKMEGLSAFVLENLQFPNEGGLGKFFEGESLNVEEKLCGVLLLLEIIVAT